MYIDIGFDFIGLKISKDFYTGTGEEKHGAIFVPIVMLCAWLLGEKAATKKARRQLSHVVQVNGTRGKTAVSRLIQAGLTGGGIRAVAKTTGTLPQLIDADGVQTDIRRRGAPNIKEQAWTVRKAARMNAQVLVAECMAVRPEYQRVSQRMLEADVAVITNIRPDHFEEMGHSLEEIARSVCQMLPTGGAVFTTEKDALAIIQEEEAKRSCAVSFGRNGYGRSARRGFCRKRSVSAFGLPMAGRRAPARCRRHEKGILSGSFCAGRVPDGEASLRFRVFRE